jgi:3-hydroxyisobutyrate dehydrogenase-like beta-hydroxyacid dehydrogenase
MTNILNGEKTKMSSLKIGFIGLGNMGMPMAKSLVRGGFSLTVFDLNNQAVEEMKALGAAGAGSSREVAETSDVVISMVWDIPQTEEVIFGKDGVWKGLKKGTTIVISSSIGPEYCRKLYTRAKQREVRVIDCCVTGRDPLGENRPMTLVIGGDEDIVKRCWPVFEALGKNVFFLGGIGTGQSYKLVHNMIAKHIGAASRDCLIEGLNLGLKAGLDLQKMVEVLSAGAAARTMQSLGFKSGLDLKKIFEIIRAPAARVPGVKAHRESELDYAMEMAEAVGAKMPVCQLIDELDMAATYDAYYALMKREMAKTSSGSGTHP